MGNPVRVLVIEDNVLAAETMREALEIGGHTVDVAHTGSGGVAMALAVFPDVVFCDVSLPDIDGLEVARALRSDERLRAAFLVAVTGHALPSDEKKALDAGFDRYVAKPLSLKRLEQVMAEVAVG
jgi:CheY-like chemotaxis protein